MNFIRGIMIQQLTDFKTIFVVDFGEKVRVKRKRITAITICLGYYNFRYA